MYLILIAFRSIPLVWIRDHLSFRRSDSVSRSSRVISGLILTSFERDLPLNNKRETSIVRVSLTSIGLGFDEESRYFPSLKRSRIESGLILFSPSVTSCVILSTSCFRRSCLGVPLSHSFTPYTTTLNLRSPWAWSATLFPLLSEGPGCVVLSVSVLDEWLVTEDCKAFMVSVRQVSLIYLWY